MNFITRLQHHITSVTRDTFSFPHSAENNFDIAINLDNQFGDLSYNAAMILARYAKQSPRDVATKLIDALKKDSFLDDHVARIEIAGPGFINLWLTKESWHAIAFQLYYHKHDFFKLDKDAPHYKYLIEFVSANPTGPLTLANGRNGIIGDVLARVLSFLDHDVTKEFYINDAGNQIGRLATSFKIRCQQACGQDVALPEECYQGEYLVDLAKQCIEKHGCNVLDNDDEWFATYAKDAILNMIKEALAAYRIEFNNWFSEKSLHDSGAVQRAVDTLRKKGYVYEQDGALWFRATEFGDDKDRVIQKQDGSFTYIAADIAYHQNKFDRGYDYLIDILGQDHHGYIKRLKATMDALGYPADHLEIIIYQLVSIKKGSQLVRMSKRKGNFTTAQEIIDTVGADVARFFYLNRKAEAHLEFDLDMAVKKSDENPAYYLQYAYVRAGSILDKARAEHDLHIDDTICHPDEFGSYVTQLDDAEIILLKKIISLHHLLTTIARSYQTHLLAYYTFELAQQFHAYYAHNRIIDPDHREQTRTRLMLTHLFRSTMALCLNLLGLSKPESM